MDDIQLLEIEKYLKTKNLTQDIFLEVFDHFTAQVENLIKTEEMTFPVAFLVTKKKWQNEFIPVKKSIISLKKVPRIVKNIYLLQEKVLKRKAIIFGFLLLVLQIIIAKFFGTDFSVFSNILLNVFIFSVIIISGFSMLLFSKENDINVLGVYFKSNLFSLILIFCLISVFNSFLDFPVNIHKFFFDSVNSSAFFNEYFLSVVLTYAINNVLISYLIMYLVRYFKMKKKIEWAA